jgi:hypothetical protein
LRPNGNFLTRKRDLHVLVDEVHYVITVCGDGIRDVENLRRKIARHRIRTADGWSAEAPLYATRIKIGSEMRQDGRGTYWAPTLEIAGVYPDPNGPDAATVMLARDLCSEQEKIIYPDPNAKTPGDVISLGPPRRQRPARVAAGRRRAAARKLGRLRRAQAGRRPAVIPAEVGRDERASVRAADIARAHGCRAPPDAGGNYQCRFPGPLHRNGDPAPSLSVKDGGNGRPLLFCFAGCSYGEIVNALDRRGGRAQTFTQRLRASAN